MSSIGSQYQFLPYIRRGLAATITSPDSQSANLPLRGILDVEIDFQGQGSGQSSSAKSTVQIKGPGDIVGIVKEHVIRTEPVSSTNNFESNFFAAIEFDQLDLPWRYTTGGPNGQNQLMPCWALVVLAHGEFDVSISSSPLPSIIVHNAGKVLPNISELWAWAHVQISGQMPPDLNSALTTNPGIGLSRIICPRHLEPSTSYFGFLVPIFNAGVAAGLGQDFSSTTLSPAWTPATTSDVTLPVYYGLKNTGSSPSFEFQFQTSDQGDFESLVRRLQRVILPDTVGTRPMDVSNPDQTGAVNSPSEKLLELEGALASPLWVPISYPSAGPDNFQNSLSNLLDLTSSPLYDPNSPDPQVVPPFYGNWYIGAQSVTPEDGSWLSTLNLDPRNRAAAGLGVQVVLKEIRALIASAWKQAGDLKKANELLNLAQFSREVLSCVMTNELVPLSDQALLAVTAPIQSRIISGAQTLATKVASSPIPSLVLSWSFGRIFRPYGPVRRRQQKVTGNPLSPYNVIGNLNSNQVQIAPPPSSPNGMTSIDQASSQSEPSGIPKWLDPIVPFLFWIFLGLGIFAFLLVIIIGILLSPLVAEGFNSHQVQLDLTIALALLGAFLAAAKKSRPIAAQTSEANSLQSSNVTPQVVLANPPQQSFQVFNLGTVPVTITGTVGIDSPDAVEFRDTAVQLTKWLQLQAPAPPAPVPLDLRQECLNILTRLDPSITVLNRIYSRLNFSPSFVRPTGIDPLGPIMWAPNFQQPMYLPLSNWSQDLLLPGVGKIQPESLALLIENRTFIESYMLGLNVELGRQLLWNGFPTDQRGSYFRQFWDVSGFIPQPTNDQQRESLYDISPINTWNDTSEPLGNHTSSQDTQTASVILLVRGELLKRYPHTQIYAAPAVNRTDPSDPPLVIDSNEKKWLTPIYQGSLKPDIRFFGFNLTADMIKGSDPNHHNGWFFVFQQLPGMPRFGLEPIESMDPRNPKWADLSWVDFNFGTDFASPNSSPIIANTPSSGNDANNKWGADAAQMAYITMRVPQRVAYLGKYLLPQANNTDTQSQNLATLLMGKINNVAAKGPVAMESRQ